MESLLESRQASSVASLAHGVGGQEIPARSEDQPNREEAVPAGASHGRVQRFGKDGLLPGEYVTHGSPRLGRRVLLPAVTRATSMVGEYSRRSVGRLDRGMVGQSDRWTVGRSDGGPAAQ